MCTWQSPPASTISYKRPESSRHHRKRSSDCINFTFWHVQNSDGRQGDGQARQGERYRPNKHDNESLRLCQLSAAAHRSMILSTAPAPLQLKAATQMLEEQGSPPIGTGRKATALPQMKYSLINERSRIYQQPQQDSLTQDPRSASGARTTVALTTQHLHASGSHQRALPPLTLGISRYGVHCCAALRVPTCLIDNKVTSAR
jgi:hypothetical protein